MVWLGELIVRRDDFGFDGAETGVIDASDKLNLGVLGYNQQ